MEHAGLWQILGPMQGMSRKALAQSAESVTTQRLYRARVQGSELRATSLRLSGNPREPGRAW